MTGKLLHFLKYIPAVAFLIAIIWIVFSNDSAPPSDLRIGFFRIHLYGLMLSLGIISAWILARAKSFSFGISKDQVDSAAVWIVVGGVIGARIYFVLLELGYFLDNPLEIAAFWHGGWSIFGALFGGLLSAYIYAKKSGIDIVDLYDLGFLSLPLAQAVGRWGNYFNQEAFGKPTELAWKLFISSENRPIEFIDQHYFHPTFLYESLWNLVVLSILLYLLSGKEKRPGRGAIAASYLVLYGMGRFFIEQLRLDSSYLGSVRVDQAVALAAVAVGAVIFILLNGKRKKTESNN